MYLSFTTDGDWSFVHTQGILSLKYYTVSGKKMLMCNININKGNAKRGISPCLKI